MKTQKSTPGPRCQQTPFTETDAERLLKNDYSTVFGTKTAHMKK
jgi:hypothetical protein